jgi:hypothetical protein
MKTPREILLAQHRAAEPKLDAIRRAVVVEELNNQVTQKQSWAQTLIAWFLRCSNIFWRELIWPSRRIWAGLAAVWLVILMVNIAGRDPSPAGKNFAAPTMMSVRDQQRFMNELFADRSVPTDADRPRNFTPRPRTETSETAVV